MGMDPSHHQRSVDVTGVETFPHQLQAHVRQRPQSSLAPCLAWLLEAVSDPTFVEEGVDVDPLTHQRSWM
jgi:hypothetical protein